MTTQDDMFCAEDKDYEDKGKVIDIFQPPTNAEDLKADKEPTNKHSIIIVGYGGNRREFLKDIVEQAMKERKQNKEGEDIDER